MNLCGFPCLFKCNMENFDDANKSDGRHKTIASDINIYSSGNGSIKGHNLIPASCAIFVQRLEIKLKSYNDPIKLKPSILLLKSRII